MDKLEAGVELVAKRVVGNQKAVNLIDNAAQLLDLINTADIAVEAKGTDVAPFGRNLNPQK